MRVTVTAALAATVLTAMATAQQQGAPSYSQLVERVKSGDLSIDFRALRFACLKQKDCIPEGSFETLQALRQARQQRDNETALNHAEQLLKEGYVNIEAHAVLAQIYVDLNKPEQSKLHHDIMKALIESITRDRDGKTPQSAFDVVCVREEYIVVSYLGFPRPSSQALQTNKPHSYDVLKTRDTQTGKDVELYFNIDAFFPPKM